MPEGPELHMSSSYVSVKCRDRIFGRIYRWPGHKCADIPWTAPKFRINSTSRGKEMQLTLTPVLEETLPEVDEKNGKVSEKKKVTTAASESLRILFQFGMSGKFEFYQAQSVDDLRKHAHLNFFTDDHLEPMVLSYIDYRRFGKWRVDPGWSPDRGPCVLSEYPAFRTHVLSNLESSTFNKAICEALLDQKFFNGIGNYLRAEILYRAGIRPFEQARKVLEPLVEAAEEGEDKKVKVKQEGPDILQLCNLIPLEVVGLGTSGYLFADDDYKVFSEWLQCYYNPTMRNMADRNKRTIWFHGDPGPMVPREVKSRTIRKTSKVYKNKLAELGMDEEEENNTKSVGKKRTTKRKEATKDSSTPSAKKGKQKEQKSKADKKTGKKEATPRAKKANRKTADGGDKAAAAVSVENGLETQKRSGRKRRAAPVQIPTEAEVPKRRRGAARPVSRHEEAAIPTRRKAAARGTAMNGDAGSRQSGRKAASAKPRKSR